MKICVIEMCDENEMDDKNEACYENSGILWE